MRLAALLLMLLLAIDCLLDSSTSSPSQQNQNHHRRRRRRRHDDYDEADADYAAADGDDVGEAPPPPPPHLMTNDDVEDVDDDVARQAVLWQNPEHPERRQGRYIGDDQTEFVRTEYSDQVYKQVRTYSTGALPRQVECYSCMSLSYQTSWKYLQTTYIYPKVFTDRCKDPSSERGMPTVMCNSVCISLMEPDIEAGVFIGFKHIRGCMDRVLRHGFNQSALRTHRFHQNNHCRTLSRAALFNPARTTDPPAIGDVQLCSCYGERCNIASSVHVSILLFLYLIFKSLRFLD